ncbi:hypothetical protein IFM89_032733 [Coptis chinensis]|uniref:fructose-bisphosphate aldolase n=1 Tax=Coptis chinensis TaxID=261450 RepID=A0A835HID3_9MAGN|nr:hypothetical protein IFM89_032733 [Coptis chinensis]
MENGNRKLKSILSMMNSLPMYTPGRGMPSSVKENGFVQSLSREILVDGSHDIDRCADVTERVLAACYKALNDHKVLLKGTLLKPNMVTPGFDAKKVAPRSFPEYRGVPCEETMPHRSLQWCSCRCENEEQATINLNAMNQLKGKKPWAQAAFLAGGVRQTREATLGTYKGDAAVGDGA